MIVGLGNPGLRYARTRHNVGFMCVERIAQVHGWAFNRRERNALVAEGMIDSQRVLLVKPQTYMNESGAAVAGLLRYLPMAVADLLVVYDELDLPLGTIRLRPSGSAAGHNGMRSVIAHLGTQEIARLRIGIGRPPGRMDPVEYVLSEFRPEEREIIAEAVARAADAARCFVTEGLQAAMNLYNRGNARTSG